ncbi:LysR family transcriptional regulator [Conexibacter sp. SYSU D00693]|uniref:LysR family transcriptional regulator n=1 Tax=Conexibacter sp. SYSU D00693 TaxID=2812560 RepID=UPI00196B4F79|nr:LysR family transcriptional regulator [Conexibacter sp. SYSU D00693]
MELRQLHYFLAVARHGHVTRAADELHLTQSALSQQVRRLEEELGVTLLRRGARGVELTAAGEELAAHARRVVDEAERLRERMDAHAGAARGVVRLAATAGDAPRVPAVLAAFHRDHPGVQLALRQAAEADVVALVRSGAADLGLAGLREALLAPVSGVDVVELADEPLVVLEPAAGGTGTEVDPAALRERPFVLAEAGSALRDAVLAVCQGAGFSPLPRFEAGDPATVRHLVAAGLAVAVVPASWARAAGPAVAVARLAGDPRHRLALLTSQHGLAPAARGLAERLAAALGGDEATGG